MKNVIDCMKKMYYKMVYYLKIAVQYAPHASFGIMFMEDIAFIFSTIMAFKSANKCNRKKLFVGLSFVYAICGILATLALKEEVPKNMHYDGWEDVE